MSDDMDLSLTFVEEAKRYKTIMARLEAAKNRLSSFISEIDAFGKYMERNASFHKHLVTRIYMDKLEGHLMMPEVVGEETVPVLRMNISKDIIEAAVRASQERWTQELGGNALQLIDWAELADQIFAEVDRLCNLGKIPPQK